MSPNYPALVTDFLALLESREIPFVIVGGIALSCSTSPARRHRTWTSIDPAAHRVGHSEHSAMFATGEFSELRVDILFAEHPVFELVAKEFAEAMDYQVGRLPTATIDGLILLKLFALPSLYRQFDFDRIAIYEADLTQLISRSRRNNGFFLDILALTCSTDSSNSAVFSLNPKPAGSNPKELTNPH